MNIESIWVYRSMVLFQTESLINSVKCDEQMKIRDTIYESFLLLRENDERTDYIL